MASLYELSNSYINALENAFSIDENTGEVIFDEELINSIGDEVKFKIDNIACYIKDLKSLSEAIKIERDNLSKRKESLDNKAERLTEYIAKVMTSCNLDSKPLDTPRNRLSFRKSESVLVFDEGMIEPRFIKEEVVRKIDKKSIKEALKNGEDVSGCGLSVSRNLQIK